MKKVILISLLLLISISFRAQNPYRGEINVVFEPGQMEAKSATLQAQIDLTRLKIARNDMILFSPRLVSLDGSQEIVFDPVTVAGIRRSNVIKREAYFNQEEPEILSKNFHVITNKSSSKNIPLAYTVPFEKWMRHSRLIVKEQTFGCYSCRDGGIYADGSNMKIYQGDPYHFAEPYLPTFKMIYITPPVEDVKIINETYSAQLQFPVGKSELLPTFGNNSQVLAEVDQVINKIRTDTLLTIRSISVLGYASPEGNAANNLRLSQDRARAFVNYLHWKHQFYQADRQITSRGMGEDWDGLKKKVNDFESPDKYKILQILEGNANIERRKVLLKGLTGGITYRMLLDYVYPSLRRNEYIIAYKVRGFTAKEAQDIIRTRPKLLSLNELFMVANLYKHGSKEFTEVFAIAARQYPESPVAQFNIASSEIENGSYAMAISRLSQIETQDAFNNLAIAYWHVKEYDKALECFQKAAALGSEEAKENLEEYRKWNEDRDLS